MERPVFFLLPDVVGGVAMVVNNIVQFQSGHHNIRILAYHSREDLRGRAVFSESVGVKVVRYSYSKFDNLYHVLSGMKDIMGNVESSIVVATDSLELIMIQKLKIRVSCVFILLGDFEHYYGMARQHQNIIDRFIAISAEIYEKLLRLLPERRDDITLIYFPTQDKGKRIEFNSSAPLRVLYVARLEEGKNPLLLVEVEEELRRMAISVEWSIVGSGELELPLRKKVADYEFGNFNFHGTLGNRALQELYQAHDVFVLSSLFEGMPVSLIEAMKSGLVPIVSDIPGGIREIVRDGQNGYLVEKGNARAYASVLKKLDNDRRQLREMAIQAYLRVIEQFGAEKNSNTYLSSIANVPSPQGERHYFYKLGILDSRFLPGVFVRTLRKIKYSSK